MWYVAPVLDSISLDSFTNLVALPFHSWKKQNKTQLNFKVTFGETIINHDCRWAVVISCTQEEHIKDDPKQKNMESETHSVV